METPASVALPQQAVGATPLSSASIRNTRHGISEQTVMKNLMVHEGQTHYDQGNSMGNTKSNWGIPRRQRQPQHYHSAREYEGLSKGFASFYGDNELAASARDGHLIPERNRKHFELKQSEEQQWKRGFKPTLPDIIPPRPRGKKNVPPVETRAAMEEISDIPRGKKHLHKPENQLMGSGLQIASTANLSKKQKNAVISSSIGATSSSTADDNNNVTNANGTIDNSEFALSRKKLVMDDKRGVPVSWKGPPFFAPTESDETLFEGLRNRSVQRTEAQKRNGIPCKNAGDLPYKSVEQAPGYVQSMNPKASKCGYEKQAQPFVFVDRFAQKEGGMRRTQEINDVRGLPNY